MRVASARLTPAVAPQAQGLWVPRALRLSLSLQEPRLQYLTPNPRSSSETQVRCPPFQEAPGDLPLLPAPRRVKRALWALMCYQGFAHRCALPTPSPPLADLLSAFTPHRGLQLPILRWIQSTPTMRQVPPSILP